MGTVSSDLDSLVDLFGERCSTAPQRFIQAMFDAAPEGVWVINAAGCTVLVNPRMAAMLGRRVADMHGLPLLDFVDPQDRSYIVEAMQPCLAGTGGRHEFRMVHKSERPVHVVGTCSPLTALDGSVIGAVAMITDITAHRDIEEQLRSRLRYEEAAAFCAQLLVGAVNLDEVLPKMCRKLLDATAVSRVYVFEDFVDARLGLCMRQRCEIVAEGIPPEIDNPILQRLPYARCAVDPLPAFRAGRHYECLVREVASDRNRRIMQRVGIKSLLLLPVTVEDAPWGFVGFNDCRVERFWRAEDIRVLRTTATILGNAVESDRAQQRVRTYQRRLQRLASELTLAEERGRRKVAADLHDHVSQALALATMHLKALADRAPDDLARDIEGVQQLVEQTVRHTRTLTFDLSPPVLYELGLGAAIEWLADTMRAKHGLSVTVARDDGAGRIDETVRVLLFRAVRELLVNVAKHAGAAEARVRLTGSEDSVDIVVEDDGCGFDVAEMQSRGAGGFGLFDIRERIAFVGGRLDVESYPGQGTRVRLHVSLGGERFKGGGGKAS